MKSLASVVLLAGCGLVTGIDVTAPPTATERATPFVLADATAQPTALAGLLAHGDVALVFFRGHW